MTQEALKLALEWAEANGEVVFAGGGMDAVNKMNSWATAIKKALAQQELVAWLSTDSIGERHLCFDKPLDNDPVQPLYTTPPRRTWVGLTDEEYDEIWRMDLNNKDIMDKTIAKLKELNA